MRVFLIVFVLISIHQPLSKADSLSDFSIEGISVGDSLLKYVNEEKVQSIKSTAQYDNDKFILYKIDSVIELEQYETLTVAIKKNDNKFEIESVSGSVSYDKLQDCIKLKNEIQKEIEGLFKSNDKQETNFASIRDKSGKSKVIGIQNYLKDFPSEESITINCYNFTDESGIPKHLKVSANSHDYAYFVINEAYK